MSLRCSECTGSLVEAPDYSTYPTYERVCTGCGLVDESSPQEPRAPDTRKVGAKACLTCGRLFMPNKSYQLYCSDGCRIKAFRNK